MHSRDAHLSDHDLLRHLDGELDAAQEAVCQRHLASCWHCRAERDALQATITTVVRALDDAVLPRTAPPPGPWHGLGPRLAQIDEQFAAQSRFSRWRPLLTAALQASRLGWAALVLVAVASFIVLVQQRTVTAAELVAQARPVEALTAHRQLLIEEYQPILGRVVNRHRIEVWHNATTRERTRRLYDERGTLVAGEWTRADGARTVYRRNVAPYRDNATAPLPASPDNLWRLDLAAVTLTTLCPALEGAIVDRRADTLAVTAPLTMDGLDTPSRVTVTFRRSDLHPIELSFRFGDANDARTFRIVEQLFAEMRPEAISAAAFLVDPGLAEPPSGAKTLAAAPPVPTMRRLRPEQLTELHIETLAQLDRVGALLGEQVTVSQTASGRVRVDALVDTAARKAELARALDALGPSWALDLRLHTFDEAQSHTRVATTRTPSVRSVAITGARPPAYDEVRRFFAARQPSPIDEAALDREVRAFIAQVLQQSLQARLHARAMTQAIALLPADRLAHVTPQHGRQWRTLLRDHADAFRHATTSLRAALQPVFTSTSTPAAAPSLDESPLDVPDTVSRLVELSTAHDVVIGQALTISARAPRPEPLISDDFWQSLNNAEALAARLASTLAAASR